MTIYNLIILDESGSMASIKPATISGFNELIQRIRMEADKDPEQEQWVNLYSFNSGGIRELLPLQRATELPQLTEATYRPDAMTPLFDAIGHATGRLRKALEGQSGYAVLVTILTDGAENDSKEYSGQAIGQIVRQLEQQQWVFTYMGTNQDVQAEAAKISISNYFSFKYSEADTRDAIHKEATYRSRFYLAAKEGKLDDIKRDFFKDDEEEGGAAPQS